MALSLFQIKQMLNPQVEFEPEDDIRILDSWTEYLDDDGSPEKRRLDYLCFEIEVMNPTTGEIIHCYKAIKFCRVIRLPAAAKQSTSFMDMHEQILTAVYKNGYNMITLIANMIKPNPVGLIYMYGIQGVASSLEDAKQIAHNDFLGLTGSLTGTFRVLELRVAMAEEVEWLRDKMYHMDYMTMVRGIPKAQSGGEDAGNKGIGGRNLNPESQGTLEEIITGLVDYEYVIQILSSPVYRDTIEGWLFQSQKEMTEWNSRLQGQTALSANLSIPMMYMANAGTAQGWSHGISDSTNLSFSQGENFSHTEGQSVGESLSRNFSQGINLSEGSSYTESVSRGVSVSNGISVGDSYGVTHGVSHTIGQSQGYNFGENFGLSEGNTLGRNAGISEGVNIGQAHGLNQGISENQSIGLSENNSINQTHGTSQNATINTSNGFNQGVTLTQGQGESSGTNYNVTSGINAGTSHNVGINQGLGYNTNESVNIGNTAGTNQNVSSGLSRNLGQTDSFNQSNSVNNSENWGASYNHGTSQSSTHNTSESDSIGVNVTPLGIGGSYNHGWTEGDAYSTGTTDSIGISNGGSSGTGSSAGFGQSFSDSAGSSSSIGYGNSISENISNGQSIGQSQNFGTNESYGETFGQSLSEGFGASRSINSSLSLGNNYGTNQSISNGVSEGINDSTSFGRSMGLNQSLGIGSSQGISDTSSFGTNYGSNTGVSSAVNTGATMGYSNGQNFGTNESIGTSDSVSRTQSITQSQTVSENASESRSIGKNISQGYSENISSGYGQNYGQNESVSSGVSNTESTGISRGINTGTNGNVNYGMSSSMGLGPSIGYSKTHQWLNQQIKDLLELYDYQNERLKYALHGLNGAFYTYVYIACPNEDCMRKAQAIAASTWTNKEAKVNPLQVLDLSETEQSHLLDHFHAFSADVSREDVYGVDEYKYCTVLLPNEYAAYTHLPRISEGGVWSSLEDIPKFAVPSGLKGDIYMGTILNPERWSFENEYRTPYDYRIDEQLLLHGYFAGASGSGKTTAAMRFIKELAGVKRSKTGKKLRIVIMDPKQDWRIMARFIEPERFKFYSMGNVSFRPIKINPWKIPEGVWPQIWIDGVINIYCRSYGLLELGKQMISTVVYELYDEVGVFEACNSEDWRTEVSERSKAVNFARIYQSMISKKIEMEEGSNGKGKSGFNTLDNYNRLIERLSAFGREYSIEYELYGTSEGIGIDELIGDDDITVLESYGLEETFNNFIFGIITSGFYKYAISHEGGYFAENQYETVLVIEEANKVLTGNDNAQGGNQVSLSGESEFEQILDQARGYGMYVMAITQKIADMPSSVIANAGMVFAGRQQREIDKQTIINALGKEARLDDRDLFKFLSNMPKGWFICRMSNSFDWKEMTPILVQIAAFNTSKPSNLELEEILTHKESLILLEAV